MPEDPPPRRQGSKATLAYALCAAAIWGLVAYSQWGPRPQPAHPYVLARACAR